jgi:hypothetical protein
MNFFFMIRQEKSSLRVHQSYHCALEMVHQLFLLLLVFAHFLNNLKHLSVLGLFMVVGLKSHYSQN